MGGAGGTDWGSLGGTGDWDWRALLGGTGRCEAGIGGAQGAQRLFCPPRCHTVTPAVWEPPNRICSPPHNGGLLSPPGVCACSPPPPKRDLCPQIGVVAPPRGLNSSPVNSLRVCSCSPFPKCGLCPTVGVCCPL